MTASMSPDLVANYREIVCKPRDHQHPVTPRAMAECCLETMAKLDAEC